MIKIYNYNTIELAKEMGKEHCNLMKSIKILLKNNPELNNIFIKSTYKASLSSTIPSRNYPMYVFDSKGKELLLFKFKYGLKTARFELMFGNELIDFFKHYNYEVLRQYSVCNNKYYIDFYVPSLNLAIEYDESGHNFESLYNNEAIRQKEIEKELRCTFIRIGEHLSVGESLGIISKYILKIA